jgi:hypothetical protein
MGAIDIVVVVVVFGVLGVLVRAFIRTRSR